MQIHNSSSRGRLPFVLGLAAILLAGCSPVTATVWPMATLQDGKILLASSQAVFAIDAVSGAQLWRFPAENNSDLQAFESAPAVNVDRIIVASGNKMVLALSAATGVEAWRYQDPNQQTKIAAVSLSAADGRSYSAIGTTLRALDNEQGTVLWQFAGGDEFWGAPATSADTIYVPNMDHKLSALDAKTGALRWERSFPGALAATPALADAALYVGNLSRALYAVNAANGKDIWVYATQGFVWGTPLVTADRIYFGDLDGVVYCVNRSSGSEIWRATAAGSVRGTPALDGDKLFVVTDSGFVHAFNAGSGTPAWQLELDAKNAERLLDSPIAANGLLYVSAYNGEHLLYALLQESGTTSWFFPPATR